MTTEDYELIPMSEITDEARKIAVAWMECEDKDWIGQKHKLASDIMNYANKQLKQPLYAFLYNPMIHESGYITISIHRTLKGAEKALEWHKKQHIKEIMEGCGKYDEEWDNCRSWKIETIQIQD